MVTVTTLLRFASNGNGARRIIGAAHFRHGSTCRQDGRRTGCDKARPAAKSEHF